MDSKRKSDIQHSSSSVNLGTGNILWGSIGDIAGRDVNKSWTINYYERGILSPETRNQLEQEYLKNLVKELEIWDGQFIDLDLKIQAPPIALLISSELLPFVGDEFRLLLESQTDWIKGHSQFKSLLDLLLRSNAWLLSGDPGSGKTTLLRKLAYDQAQISLALRARAHTQLLHTYPNVKERFPVFLDLSRYDGNTSLMKLLEKSWLGNPLGLEMENYLGMRKVLLLIDSIERVSNEVRSQAIYEIRELVSGYPGNQCVVAARSYSLNDDIGFPISSIEPLTPSQAITFLAKYSGDSRLPLYSYVKEQRPELLWLTRNPYTLLMLLSDFLNTASVTSNLADLSDRFTSTMFARQFGTAEKVDKISSIAKRKLAEVAFALTLRDGGLRLGSQQQIDINSVGTTIESETIELGKNAGILLVSSEREQIQFVHSMLQAYYSAVELQIQREQNMELPIDLVGLQQLSESDLKFPRAQPFAKPSVNENPWDSQMTIISRDHWYQAIRMLAWMEQTPTTLLEQILMVNPILVADLMTLHEYDLPHELEIKVKNALISLISDRNTPKRIRLTAAHWLGELGDPRVAQHDMVFISGIHDFIMGTENNSHSLIVQDFYVDQYLVTNFQYSQFIEEMGYEQQIFWTSAGWSWVKSSGRTQPTYWQVEPFNFPNAPVVGISWYEAAAYAKWKGLRLLSEPEWEYLATFNPGTSQKQLYPWGNRFDYDAANLMKGEYMFRTTPVGIYPLGVNYWGVHDLAGNVWEWLSSLYLPYPFNLSRAEDYERDSARCLRGGSWGFDATPGAQGTVRYSSQPSSVEHLNRGFRCARSGES